MKCIEEDRSGESEVCLALAPRQVEMIRRIDTSSSGSIMSFGCGVQNRFQQISSDMLRSVRVDEGGLVDGGMDGLARVMRGFSIQPENLRSTQRLFERLLFRKAPIEDFSARIIAIRKQVDLVATDLLRSRHRLRVDLRRLDDIHDRCKAFHAEIGDYIEAGRAKLMDIDGNDLPRLRAARDAAEGSERMMCEHRFHDAIAARDNLERRVHDLELTRIAAMQALPAIRIIRENDIALLSRIDMMVSSTIPLWEAQMAHAVNLQNAADATRAVTNASVIAGQAIRSNARALNDLNRDIRTSLEAGGVPDVEAMREAQSRLIAAIEDSLEMAQVAAQARTKAADELNRAGSGLQAHMRQGGLAELNSERA